MSVFFLYVAGTWHSTVGHEHSFSLKRSSFDLELLYRDLEMCGHDPHTHKYLGITHLAHVVTSVAAAKAAAPAASWSQEALLTPDLLDHLQRGYHFCELRADPDTVYTSEFAEERWECMLQMALTASEVVSE
jgi:hypothetical protein